MPDSLAIVAEQSETQLALYDAMCTAIAAAYQVDEIMTIRDKARLMEAAAKIAGNTEAEDRCYQIRWRAVRRLGQIMAEQKATIGMSTGGRPTEKTGLKTNPVSRLPTLDEAGIDKNLAHTARTLASVPEKQFEAAFTGEGPTIAELVGKSKPQSAPQPERDFKPKKPAARSADSERAMWLWARVRDFERDGVLATSPAACLREMDDFQVEDLVPLIPRVIEWLDQFLALATQQETP